MDNSSINWPGLLAALAAISLALGILAGAASAATGGAGVPAAGPPLPPSSEAEPAPASEPSSGDLTLASAQTSPRRSFYFGVRETLLRFVIASTQAENDLRIDVVDAAGETVRSFYRNDVAPGTTNSIRWDGSTAEGRAAANGKYEFRIASQAGAPVARARTSSSGQSLGFSFYRYIFPVQGAHTYGDGIGAQRVGHTHQGQDLAAACGTPVVAARGGRIRFAGYEAGGAGYYAVIDGKGTGQDTVYMHMLKPALLPTGSLVRTGQTIGYVGNTGDSSGCHLHFELWSAPGWYEGGQFMDPTPLLERADRYS